MGKETDIGAIAVKDKKDVLRAAEILEKYHINVFSSKETRENYLNDDSKFVNNNFLMNDKDGWRIQSHYIGFGIKPEEIEELIQSGEATFNGKKFVIPKTKDEILEGAGWTIISNKPLEIWYKDGSSATGLAAQYCIDGIIAEYNKLK